MPITGLLITLADDPRHAAAAVATMRSDPRIDLGERRGARLPVVAETPGDGAERRLVEELTTHPGIVHVDVVCAYFDEESVGGGAEVVVPPPAAD